MLKADHPNPYSFEIKDLPDQPAMSIRVRTNAKDLPAFLGEAFGKIAQYLGECGEAPAGPPFAGYFNMDMENLDVEAGFPVARPLPGRGEIEASQLPGKAATALYTGPYDRLNEAYDALNRWVKDQGCQVTGASYEMYLNDPGLVAPEELQTRIVFPIK